MYKPLSKNLTIKKSRINGLGMFATEDINSNNVLGVSHIQDLKAEDGYWRTPLGGFINSFLFIFFTCFITPSPS